MRLGFIDVLKQGYEEVLSTPAGRLVLGSIFINGAAFDSLYERDPHNLAYAAGSRDAVMGIRNFVAAIDPHLAAECEVEFRKRRSECGRIEDDDD